jgi:hypothetical protein
MVRTIARSLLALASVAFLVTAAAAQEGHGHEMTPEQKAEWDAYMKAATPGAPHQKLAAKAGTYDLRMKSWHEPGGPAMESTGTATRAMILDGRVLVEDVTGTMMDMTFRGHGMFGYDNVTGKHWSTWTDNLGTGVMLSEGTCDAQGACTLTGSWNDPVRGKVTARMTTRWTSPTVQVFEMYGPDRSGKEMKMMEITYTKR